MRPIRLHRRAVLRGLGSIAVGLPLLEAMRESQAQAQAGGAPTRFVVTFGGLTSGAPRDIVPDRTGPGYEVKKSMDPIGDLGVQDKVTVVSDLHMPKNGDGGWHSRWHSSSVGPILSGVSANGDGVPGADVPDHGTPVPRGPTADQMFQAASQGETRFPSLHYRAQPEVYRENDARFGVISYRDNNGKLEPNTPTHSPKLAYDTLFTGFTPNDPAQAASELARLAQNRSILDTVSRRSDRFLGRLSLGDQQRVERHLNEIRNIEKLLQAEPQIMLAGGQCSRLDPPGDDPEVTTSQHGNFRDLPRFFGWSNEERRAEVMTDLLHMALTCDLTRTATLAYTFAQSFINTKDLLDIRETDMHQAGHAGGDEAALCFGWHMKHFGALVKKMSETPEGDGTLLDNTVMVFLTEGGWAGGDPHTGENMVLLTAGGAGGLVEGHHISAGGKHPASVLVSALNAAGVDTNQMGEITGGVDGLVA